MKKKTSLMISLIISLLSLLYLITDYYGGTRYVLLHNNQMSHYINKYTKLPKASKSRVIVCFSAPACELENMDPFLNSILDQTVRVDEILLITPYDNVEKVSPKYKKILSVNGYKKNYDKAANLVCSVLTEPDATTKIIIIDNSIIYPVDFIETMTSQSDKNSDKIIYGSPTKETKYGILVKPGFFDDKISKYEDGCSKESCCQWLDRCTNISSIVANCGVSFPRW